MFESNGRKTEIIFKKTLPECPCNSLVNNDEKIVFIDCCKDYPSANFGKGFGENLFFARKRFSPGNWQAISGTAKRHGGRGEV